MKLSKKSSFILATLTSEITLSEAPHQMETFSELFDSDNDFIVGIIIVDVLETIPEYQKAVENGRLTVQPITSIEFPDKVTITRCDIIENFLADSKDKSYYILRQKAYSFVSLHEMGHTNPYTETFQDLVNRAYSAGLNQAWETLEGLKKFASQIEEGSSMLTFEDLIPILQIFPFIYVTAILIFLLEILHAKLCRVIRRMRRNRVELEM